MTSSKSLAPLTPQEAKAERFASLVVYGPEDGDGKGLTPSQAGKVMHLNAREWRKLWASTEVQNWVRNTLDSMRQHAELKIADEVELAIRTLRLAMLSPEVKKTQVDAAKAILSLHMQKRGDVEIGNNIQVVVNTGLPEGLLQRQQAISMRPVVMPEVAEAEYTEVE